jgi:hypothetical protein
MQRCSHCIVRRLRHSEPGEGNALHGRGYNIRETASRQGAALLIVLAMVVLLTGLAVAYLSRTTSDRQVAHSSFHQSKVDELAASAMDLVIGDLRTEIANGSSPTPTPVCNVSPVPPCGAPPTPTPAGTPVPCAPSPTPFVYFPTPANILPVQWPTSTPNTTPILNLIRVSKRGDKPGDTNPIPAPGVPSYASAVNSSSPTEASANGRYVKLPRWNKHYLIPRPSPTPAGDTNPIAAFSPAPDWVILTRNGPVAFNAWCPVLADPAEFNNFYCVGRYAYAIYDEGGLLDANVAGFPSGTTAAQYGPKGTSAFADLTALGLSQTDINAIVGWRNYFSAGPSGTFPNFNFNAAAATNYVASVLSNTNGFMTVPVPTSTPNNMSNTDQQFTTRQSLINVLANSGLSDANSAAYALQYLGTFSRELNAPSWAPTLNALEMGGSNGTGNPPPYAYKDNAANSALTPINPNLMNVRVCSQNGCGFTRADGTQAVPGEPLIKTRFSLTRLGGVTPTGNPAGSTMLNGALVSATAATVQRDFGLLWNSTSSRWDYVGSSGSTVQSSIETLWQVANENPGREPNFFELLKAAILSGSVGMGSGTGNLPTFVTAETKYYDTDPTASPPRYLSSDYQIMQIGANIINQWDSGNVPIFIGFGQDPLNVGNPYELAGIKNLPYLNKIVFKPAWTSSTQFTAWLVPSLWNPHQNAPPSASQNVRIVMTAGTMTATVTSGGGGTITSSAVVWNPSGNPNQYMTVDASAAWLGTSPSGPTAASPASGSNITQMPNSIGGYYGFHFTFATNPSVTRSNAQTAYPDFGSSPGCTFEMQAQVGTIWKTYQRWRNCGPNHPLVFQPPTTGNWWSNNNLQDPEFVTLDPRTLRFGVWGNAYSQSADQTDITAGTQATLDAPPVEAVTALRPQGSGFNFSTSPNNLYSFANNPDPAYPSVYYKDLDQATRSGDFATVSTADDMQLTAQGPLDRPLALNGNFQNGVFQSVAELGHVFRDQPWKSLNFTSAMPTTSTTKARSADSGLLDVFTLHESSMEAGKTSLNTKQPLVLKAILGQTTSGGAIKRLAGGTTDLLTQAQRDAIVVALQGLRPIVNKTELVTRLSSDASVTGLGNKEARECVLRAFSDAGQTRTWNLLIDLIAQSGRYPSTAASGPNTTNPLANFVVEGEVHYWVHVAIDRFTGQVIDKQIEIVNE